jgi:hypothetical protein
MNVPVKLHREILADIRATCKKNKVKLVFDHKQEFLDGDKDEESSAYFMDDPALIKVSTKNKTPLKILHNTIHETCHMDQWLEEAKVWNECYIDGVDVSDLAQLWIDKKIELNKQQSGKIFLALYNLEMDAERRAVKKFKHYGLDKYMDVTAYIQGAYAYGKGYLFTGATRKWIPATNQPYKIDEIVAAQPEEFYKDGSPYVMNWIADFTKHYPDYNVIV